jgi:hypothetical protein
MKSVRPERDLESEAAFPALDAAGSPFDAARANGQGSPSVAATLGGQADAG